MKLIVDLKATNYGGLNFLYNNKEMTQLRSFATNPHICELTRISGNLPAKTFL